MLTIIFPSDAKDESTADPVFTREIECAQQAGFECSLYSHHQLVQGETTLAVQHVPANQQCLLRGWMLSPEQYSILGEGLRRRNSELIVSAGQYAEAHYLPNAYQHLIGQTAQSRWIEGRDLQQAWELYQHFRAHDAIIKDFAKSAKARWREACFLPSGSTFEAFADIFHAFVNTRGKLFQRGCVIRRFLPLRFQGRDMRGMPIAEEYRLFFWRGELLYQIPFTNSDLEPMLALWTNIAQRFSTPFLSMDVAPLETGGWTIVEVGDAGVSGLPSSAEPLFFNSLYAKFSH